MADVGGWIREWTQEADGERSRATRLADARPRASSSPARPRLSVPIRARALRQASRYPHDCPGLHGPVRFFPDQYATQLAFVVARSALPPETVLREQVRHEVARVGGAQRAPSDGGMVSRMRRKSCCKVCASPAIHEPFARKRGGPSAGEVVPVAAAALSLVDQLAAPGLCGRIHAAPDRSRLLALHPSRPWAKRPMSTSAPVAETGPPNVNAKTAKPAKQQIQRFFATFARFAFNVVSGRTDSSEKRPPRTQSQTTCPVLVDATLVSARRWVT